MRIIKVKPLACHKFVLSGYATDPVHRLFHPYLYLFGRGNVFAVHMPEYQHVVVHFFKF
jgi:hypothetical protein